MIKLPHAGGLRILAASSLKRQATKIIGDLQGNASPVLITQHGRKAAYLLGVDAFEGLQRRLEILKGLVRGQKALEEGRVLTHAQAKRKMKRWLG